MKESTVQTQICNALRAMGVEFFKITNEQKGSVRNKGAYWGALKREGYTAGVADLALLFPGGKIVFLEVKRPKEYRIGKSGKRVIADTGGQLSESQRKWAERVENLGFDYFVVDTARDAADIAQRFKLSQAHTFKAEGTV